jgi:hypothetical protein
MKGLFLLESEFKTDGLWHVKTKCPYAKELEAVGMAVLERGTGSDAAKSANG